jgi:hypothetical protein
MAGRWIRRTGCLLLFGLASIATASADSPASKFRKLADPAATFTSPDRQIRVEQYSTETTERDLLYQFWTFDGKHGHGTLLNPGETTDMAGYRAGFRFSKDSQWLVRMQKLGAGYHTLFLYRRNGTRFSAATPKPLGELAWDYFYSQPIAKQINRDPKDFDSLDHAQAHLVKGLDENYAWLGRPWPNSRYLVISLSFDSQGEDKPGPWIPPDFVDNNAKAVRFPDPAGK